ncbi:MAG: ABC transporter ATP-binding protein/permease [Fimbriimonadaceae bacterium]|nr:ABC transporter ATP-binding protein/permease [Fimbriimonadaceae bacterium]
MRIRGFDSRMLAELKRHKRNILLGLACSAVASGLLAIVGLFVKFILDAVANRDVAMLNWLSLGVIAIFSVKYWFTRGQTYYLSKAAAMLTAELRQRLFRKLQALPISYFNEKRAGSIQSVLTNDVQVYQSAVGVVRDAIDGPVKIISGFVMIFYLQWQLALAAMVVIPPMAWVIQRNGRKMKLAQGEVQDDLSSLTAMMQESLQGTRIVKSFSAEERVATKFSELVQRSLASQLRAVRRIATLKPTVELLGAVALAIVVFVCGQLVARGFLVVSDLASFLYFLDLINQGTKNLGSLNQTSGQVQAASDRIEREVLGVPEQHLEDPNALAPAIATGHIEFRNVSFTYADGTQALKNVSFSIEPGTSLALVGPSGSGKSTIADLLLRFYDPTDGCILFDGVDLRELRLSWLRAQIGVVPQQTFLFAGTIADNIRLGAPDATDEEVVEAARAAHAETFVRRMPQQFETELGERGIRTSGGEMQRIAIARALVRKPTMLLLDEATSNLDAHSERAVQEALDEVMRQRTTLFIAHRLTSAARADRIVMLLHGEVIEHGTHRELLAHDGPYAAMYRAFSNGVIDESLA